MVDKKTKNQKNKSVCKRCAEVHASGNICDVICEDISPVFLLMVHGGQRQVGKKLLFLLPAVNKHNPQADSVRGQIPQLRR